MNNKGQTLVLFIILLPILLILISFIVDLGLLYINNNKAQNIVKMAIRNELKCETCDKKEVKQNIINLLSKNLNDVAINKVDVGDNYIVVDISKKYKSIFSKVLKNDIYNIKVSYKGVKTNDGIVIKRSD